MVDPEPAALDSRDPERALYEEDGTVQPIRDLDAPTTDVWILMSEAEQKGYPHEAKGRHRRNP